MRCIFLFFLLTFSGLKATSQGSPELRGVWIASVLNIDWPRSSTLNEDEQKASFIELLDFYEELNFNAVFVQIRTAGDALYQSELVPWSRFLTGEEGKPSTYDPLPWMIAEAKKRNMEFHAWLNPYRATTNLDTTLLHNSHVFNQHRDWIVKYGSRYYLNPGIPEVREHFNLVVKEIIENYEVDGIHFDDYFYPYKIEGEYFADTLTYEKFGKGDFSNMEQWRRANVDSLVYGVHRVIKEHSQETTFGISPFGIWRNKDQDGAGSKTAARQTTYDDLYADPLLWCENGWIDYINPQIYWSRSFKPVKFKKLLRWWDKTVDVPVLVGLGAYKILNNFDEAWNDMNELPKQIEYSRKLEGVNGFVVFSAKSLLDKAFLVKEFQDHYFAHEAAAPDFTK